MANTKSAEKRINQTRTKTLINKRSRSRLRNQIKKLRHALDQKDTSGVQELLRPTLSIMDKSVQKGIVKKGWASRMKSRLSLRVNAAVAGAKATS
jgi:small subunit ribosomal protein S20